MSKYFGTDGIRGRYGDGITEDTAFLTGLALGEYFGGDCVVGRDTRVSGESLTHALIDGLCGAGANVRTAGILPTPAVSLLTATGGAACGVMITASHNPPQYNGIKVFAGGGVKLSEDEENEIEYLIDNSSASSHQGVCKVAEGAREAYVSALIKGQRRLDGLRICVDAANGAAGTIAAEVFTRLGASVKSINDQGDGNLINHRCGALYIDTLRERTEGKANESAKPQEAYDLSFAFDGDADRVGMLVDGGILDGDSILYTLSRKRELKNGVVVGTVMTNLALELALKRDKKRLIRTAVGDKYILDLLLKEGYSLGGEQSGHYIFYPERLTGDGILTAIKMSAAYLDGDVRRLELVPQKTLSLFAHPSAPEDVKIKSLIQKHTQNLSCLLVRMSGTEPKLRIMAQDESIDKVNAALSDFEQAIGEIRVTNEKM